MAIPAGRNTKQVFDVPYTFNFYIFKFLPSKLFQIVWGLNNWIEHNSNRNSFLKSSNE